MHTNPIDRRDFLRTSAKAAAVLAVPGSLMNLTAARPETRLGVALLGLGNYATNQLAPALGYTEHCRLAGIVTGTPSKIAEWKQKYDLPDKNIYSYDNFDSIADNPDIDIVYVVTPNALHLPFAERAARAGKHVICEKPMEISSDRCKMMIEACAKAGKKLQIGYRLRYDPFHQEIERLGREQVHGKVKMVNTGFSFYGVNNSNWRFTDPKLSGGGPMMDIGIYCLQGIRYATGEEPVAVTAQSFKTIMDKLPGMEETIFWQMEFPSGAAAVCSTSYVARDNYLRVSTENGVYGVDPAYTYGPLAGYINNQSMGEYNHRQQTAQMDAFALSIKNNTPVKTPGEEGLRDMLCIEAIYKAARKKKRISLL